MKKLLYSAVAFATLLTAACQQEDLEPVSVGDNTVTYTVQVPESMKTKATIGENLAGTFELTYEVYRANEVGDLTKTAFYENEEPIRFNEQGVATLSLQFVKRQDYVVLFWANTAESKLLYNTTDLRKVTINNAWTANDVKAAAFAGIDNVSDCISAKKGAVSLVRPVSQINIATSEESLDLRGNVITLGQSSVTVKGLFGVYNVYDKTVSNETNETIDIAYGVANVPAGEFGTVGNTTYNYVAMSYVGFAPETGTTVDVDFEFDITENNNKITIDHSVPNVPIKPNYRTNILGNLISEEHAYTVTLDTDWADNGGNMEFVTDGLVKNLNGDYEVSTEKGLAYAINNLFAEGGNFYLTKAEYDMTNYAVTAPVSVTGSLNIYGEVPSVTRATEGVVVIKGLNLAAIVSEIAEDASASFSNIVIDSETAFVGTNKGTVGFDNCANTEGNTTEKLINSNNGTVVDLQAEIEDLEDLQLAINTGINAIELTSPLVNATGTEFTLDLKGCTVSCIEESNGSYGMITNRGTLVINGAGTLQLKAVNDRDWNAYSSVISNTVGGLLTVNEGVVIEHLGGTDMAYGIDNLTNGKGTSAVTVVNGATVKSTYRAIRQFLNGIEATNELYIKNKSKVEGANKSVWMQDPNANANTGKLVVEEGAELYGDAYLFVCAGSTSWPVSVSIASSALQGESTVVSGNVPEGFNVAEVNGNWTVTCEHAAMIGSTGYESLQEAIDAVQDGETIILMNDVEITEPAYGQNALNHARAISFTLDLNGKTVAADTGNSVFRYNISSTEATSNVEVTLKNGTITAGGKTWCAIMAAGYSETAKAIFNIENLVVNASKAGDLAVKSWSNALINAKNVKINATNGSGGFYALGGEIVLDNCTVDQKGLHTAPYLSMALAVSNNGKMTVNSGNYKSEPTSASEGYNQGTTHGSWVAGVMNSGGELIINGGTFANGNFGDDAAATYARGCIFGDTASKITINGGTFNALKSIIDYQNNLGVQPNPNIVINGGNFSANPATVTSYGGVIIAEGKTPAQGTDGRWTLIGSYVVNEAADLQTAFDNFAPGQPIILGQDIVLTETAILAEGKTAVLDLNGKSLSHSDEATQYAIANLGTLTIKGNGTVNARGIYNGYDGSNTIATAKMIVENGTFNAKGTNGGAAIYNYGELVINNGTFTSIGSYSVNTQAGGSLKVNGGNIEGGIYLSGCNVEINSGNISGERSGCHVVYCWNVNSIIINGGNFYNNNSGNSTIMAAGTTKITYKGGTFGIKDGRIPGNGNTWTSCLLDFQNTASATITGGTYNGGFRVQAGTSMEITGGSFNDCYGSNYNIYGTASVKGGTYTDGTAQSFAKKYLASGYKLEGTTVVKE